MHSAVRSPQRAHVVHAGTQFTFFFSTKVQKYKYWRSARTLVHAGAQSTCFTITSTKSQTLTRGARTSCLYAVPVKTVIAEVVEAAVDGGGAGNGGHPVLRAVATPLVVAQALSDKRHEVGKEELHKQVCPHTTIDVFSILL